MARKVIAIGECGVDVEFHAGVPVRSYPGGRILNAAALLGRSGCTVDMVGECGQDRLGDMVVEYLESNKVSTRSIDRFTEGITASTFVFDDAEDIYYEQYPQEEFDFVWPSVSDKDIVMFGSFFAVSPRVRPKLYELLQYASERGAILIYLPGFPPRKAPRVTKYMPLIFENLELADMVICRTGDLLHIFGSEEEKEVYERHISFYCENFVNADCATSKITHRHGGAVETVVIDSADTKPMYNARVLSLIVKQMIEEDIMRPTLSQMVLKSNL